ncbi:7-cyano-7-deazaguanine synthase QueC [Buchnera aphidicola (Hyadaphis tataricae)]|uniref:7-cyano-7-deazaguanine synthase n=1 Tax=Buchnera aphidicola (Hyadaphis tataricae) TaxID=1241859 RepID=A0A4D6XZV0_9GAMM|nr:7-cyano-7-deazaguanine synthase QueC [Buchnera aphidicola]QCI21759.1 7-cyano-7-deazaguanine synthase QueC [Buchnera aphidicola (Hyadaphis tataricae)]
MNDKINEKVLIVFSGGQDSTTCLAYYIYQCKHISCITFNYNQLHQSEIQASRIILEKLGIKNHLILDMKYLQNLSISSLTNQSVALDKNHPIDNLLPSTFVPGRNILFLTLSSIYAYSHDINSIVLGVNEIDFSGYPDCRYEFIKNMNHVIKIGMCCHIDFEIPIMHLNKSEIWALSDYCNVLDIILNDTVTCYQGIKGSGCSKCQACIIRKKGFDKWNSNRFYYMHKMKQKMKLL